MFKTLHIFQNFWQLLKNTAQAKIWYMLDVCPKINFPNTLTSLVRYWFWYNYLTIVIIASSCETRFYKDLFQIGTKFKEIHKMLQVTKKKYVSVIRNFYISINSIINQKSSLKTSTLPKNWPFDIFWTCTQLSCRIIRRQNRKPTLYCHSYTVRCWGGEWALRTVVFCDRSITWQVCNQQYAFCGDIWSWDPQDFKVGFRSTQYSFKNGIWKKIFSTKNVLKKPLISLKNN